MLTKPRVLLVGTLSEQTSIAHVQEELKKAKRNERVGYVIGLISLLFFWWVKDFYQEVVAGLVIILSLAVSFYYASKGAKLRKQLKAVEIGRGETTRKG